MPPPCRRTSRAAATKASEKIQKTFAVWNELGDDEYAVGDSAMMDENTTATDERCPDTVADRNYQNKDFQSDDDSSEAGEEMNEDYYNETVRPFSLACDKAPINKPSDDNESVDNTLTSGSIREDQRDIDHPATAEKLRLRKAYQKRRAARMLHSDKKMAFSRNTVHRMCRSLESRNRPVSPVRCTSLDAHFRGSRIAQIIRSTRKARAVITLKRPNPRHNNLYPREY